MYSEPINATISGKMSELAILSGFDYNLNIFLTAFGVRMEQVKSEKCVSI